VKRRLQPGDKMAVRHGTRAWCRNRAVEGHAARQTAHGGHRAHPWVSPRDERWPILETHLGWPRGWERLATAARAKVAHCAVSCATCTKVGQEEEIDTLGHDELLTGRASPVGVPSNAGLRRCLRIGVARCSKMATVRGRAAARADGRAGRKACCTTAEPRGVRATGHGRLHAHAEAAPPGRRQDARAIDRPVLVVTQQRSAQGSVRRQRFGEMEVWALEAYARPTRCRRC